MSAKLLPQDSDCQGVTTDGNYDSHTERDNSHDRGSSGDTVWLPTVAVQHL